DPNGLRVAFHRRAKVVTTCDLQLDTATARCAPAAPAVPVAGQLRLPDQAPGTPVLLFAETTDPGGARPAGALYRPSDGSRLFDLPSGSLGSYVWHDGAVTTLVRNARTADAFLIRQAQGKPPEHTEVELPDPLSGGPLLAGDTMLWLTPEHPNEHRLHARRLHALGPLASDARDLGTTGPLPGPLEVETCRLGSTLAVLLRAKPKGYNTAVALALRSEAGWSPVIRAQVPSPWFGFTCHADTASLTWIEARAEENETSGAPRAGARPIRGDYVAARMLCTKSGCRKEEATVPFSRWSRASRYVIASLGPAAVVLWRSPLGDTRRRVASFSGLPKAPSRALFDDGEHGGFAWEQAGTTLLVQGTTAVLLVEAETVAGEPDTYAFVLAQDGAARPVTVTRDAP
ncbi:MAG: hypothetical protein JRI68_12965, partial [Deltaproteobacteria bacterium]|nr:hypothetical protein [Deltaproteobacteria bacterium]